ncbi:MAG: RagB/SusD family nutrient uptake outer membrane protein [Myroides sp.]|jgi:hypothetical protein|nr:RagB/SusD family nutrient uptake outer membrane protein [Myroides sp.]
MKIFINIGKYLLLCVLLAVNVSCDIDKVEPYYQLTPENTIRDEKSAQAVLNGVYNLGRQFDLGFFPLHIAAYGNEGKIISNISGSTGFNTNEIKKDNEFLSKLYNSNYKVINLANFLIEELEAGKAVGISNQRKQEMISEAKYQRAMHYFNLLRYFGEYYDLTSIYGVVLRTSFATEIEADSRATVKETYDLIISDLVFASEFGPEHIKHIYSGKIASKALLAKVKLYVGDYSESAKLAKEVIDNTEGYALESNYDDIFKNMFHSSEVLFAPMAGTGVEGGSKMEQINRTSYSEFLFGLADQQVEGIASLEQTGEYIDPRFAFAYSKNTQGVNKQAKYPHSATASSMKNTMYHMRLAEVYLIYAEALVRGEIDLPLALEQVNIIRHRAKVGEKKLVDRNTLLKDIRYEKLLEIFFENGEPLFDLIRYAILDGIDVTVEKPTLNSKHKYILPIPLTVLSSNHKLIQNPGY